MSAAPPQPHRNLKDAAPAALKPRRDGASPWRIDGRSRRIAGLRVDATSYDEAADAVVDWAERGAGGMVCVASVHTVVEGLDDDPFRRLVNDAELVTPDGMPLVWALRSLGIGAAGRVYGPALTGVLCRRAATLGIPVGFYGGTPEVLEELVRRLTRCYPDLQVAFRAAPPFRPLTPEEDAEVVEAIEASGARILFVGLGCPKQERWMAEHREALTCAMLGVGAAFDFLAGAKSQAPSWMQRGGLEWFYRLCAEPRRLWRRYLLGNPRFVGRFAVQLARSLRAGRAAGPEA